MLKQVADLEITVPSLLFLVYVTGFLSLNAHLSSYGIFESNALSFAYVKTGVLFFIYNSSLFVVARLVHNEKLMHEAIAQSIGTILCSWLGVAALFYWYEAVTIYATPFTIHFEHPIISTLLVVTSIGTVWLFSATSDGEEVTAKDKWLIGGAITCIVLNIFLLCRFATDVWNIGLYNLIAVLAFLVLFKDTASTLEDQGDDLTSSLPILAFVLMLTSLAFGRLLYPRIPVAIGGGKPYMTQLYLTKGEVDILIQSNVIADSTVFTKPLSIVYQSEKTVYVRLDGKLVGIATDGIKAYKVAQ